MIFDLPHRPQADFLASPSAWAAKELGASDEEAATYGSVGATGISLGLGMAASYSRKLCSS